MSLQHLAYSFPGYEEGNGRRWDIERRTFRTLFEEDHVIAIPVFQRRYCWSVKQIQEWWRDASGLRARRSDGTYTQNYGHGTGKCIFKYSGRVKSGRKLLVCIDGQQRCTTTQLLIAAINEALLKTSRSYKPTAGKCLSLVKTLNDFMFRDSSKVLKWIDEWAKALTGELQALDIEDGKQAIREAWSKVDFQNFASIADPVLVPSYQDRKPFFTMLARGLFVHAIHEHLVASGLGISNFDIDRLLPGPSETREGITKSYFDKMILEQLSTAEFEDQVSFLNKVAYNSLNRMSIMYCQVLQDVDLAQLFLWMQEKTLFGMGRMLFNPTPGVDFQAIDLVRNLLLAQYLDRELEFQDAMYIEKWAVPLETNGPITDKLLASFLRTNPIEHVGSFEKSLEEMAKTTPFSLKSMFNPERGIVLYARFVSYLETIEQSQISEKQGASFSAADIALSLLAAHKALTAN
mmetsp:Transcript_8514/g.13817  ORF Transcript_8514/g.13817 Transcript_8514/m.13817 type:complete len:462 (+) Transcript_8514:152-1537(+)|eukprot:CAMPEP_0203756774 /NCGR_PEP_ID=MMETSP0098-20131031/9975_1 /ASSEMBLY_ACC=CAM_ASM_000208 /TAXON_ID=96639 /ORGANISM=" , Strain NY0313808BC1" /LENGTH=461 /DNA_ID=CAMNT_0050648765 /DNA_START=133 /DNA_END=1518 /DNA_ORIENTATION=-